MRKCMKVLGVLIGIIAVGLVSSAASEQEEVQQWLNEIRAKYSGITLTALVASHPSIEAFQTMTPEFEEATGIKVRWDVVEEGLLADKAHMALGTGIYDIEMNCIEFNPGYVERGGLIDLTPYIEQAPTWFDYKDIPLCYRNLLTYKGGIYGIPFAGETVFVMYRKDVFQRYGKEPPETFADLLSLAQFFNGKDWDNDGEPEAGISFRIRRGWEATYMWSVFIFPFGGSIIDPETMRPTLNAPETIESLEYLVGLARYGPEGIEAFSFPEAWSAFMQGKVPLMVEASAAAPEIENPEKSIAAGLTGYCKMPEGPAGAYSGVWGWGFSIPSDSRHKEAAWALIAWLTSKYNGPRYVAAGGIPSRTSILKNPQYQEEHSYYHALLETLQEASALTSEGYTVVPKIPQWMELSDMIGLYVSQAVVGELTPEEACNMMQKEAEEILGSEE